MTTKFFKFKKYQKLQINSPGKKIYINCRKRPALVFNLKNDIDIEYLNNFYKNDFIKIAYMSCSSKNSPPSVRLKNDSNNSYFAIKSDFSNFANIVDKFHKFVNTNLGCFKFNYVNIETSSKINCIVWDLTTRSSTIDLHVRDDFEKFDNFYEYNYEIISGHFKEFSGKVIFDGESLKTQNFIVKFIKKPPFDKFEVNLDKRISGLGFDICHKEGEDYVISANYNVFHDFYGIRITLDNINNFLYFKLLNDISWITKEITYYRKSDVVSKMYDFWENYKF